MAAYVAGAAPAESQGAGRDRSVDICAADSQGAAAGTTGAALRLPAPAEPVAVARLEAAEEVGRTSFEVLALAPAPSSTAGATEAPAISLAVEPEAEVEAGIVIKPLSSGPRPASSSSDNDACPGVTEAGIERLAFAVAELSTAAPAPPAERTNPMPVLPVLDADAEPRVGGAASGSSVTPASLRPQHSSSSDGGALSPSPLAGLEAHTGTNQQRLACSTWKGSQAGSRAPAKKMGAALNSGSTQEDGGAAGLRGRREGEGEGESQPTASRCASEPELAEPAEGVALPEPDAGAAAVRAGWIGWMGWMGWATRMEVSRAASACTAVAVVVALAAAPAGGESPDREEAAEGAALLPPLLKPLLPASATALVADTGTASPLLAPAAAPTPAPAPSVRVMPVMEQVMVQPRP